MTKHIPRKDRWTSFGPNEHRSAQGRVYYRARQWWASLTYTVADPESPEPPVTETWEAGGFKRPRNAMIALEEKATLLERRHGDRLTFIVPD